MNLNKYTSASQAARSQADAAGWMSPDNFPAARRSASSSRSTGSAGMRGMRGSALTSALLVIALWAACTVAAVIGAKAVFSNFLSLPYVHESHATGECVAVIAPDGTKLGCENKPERYNHVWVE